MKPPAFQFYADDFLAGTITFTLEQRGLYITLLCLQWNQGNVSDRDVGALLGKMSVRDLARVLDKFEPDGSGRLRNARLEFERAKQEEFRARQVVNGQRGGRPKITQALPKPNPSHNPEEPKPNPGLTQALTQIKPRKRSPSPSPSLLTRPPALLTLKGVKGPDLKVKSSGEEPEGPQEASKHDETEGGLLQRFRKILGSDGMTNDGGKWRVRIRSASTREKALRVLLDLEASHREGRKAFNWPALAEDTWKRFA